MTSRRKRKDVLFGRMAVMLPAAVAASVIATAAFAQSTQTKAAADWTHGTTLNVFGGVGMDSATTGGAAGGAFGWEITRRLALEGTGTWFDRGTEADGFSADFAALVSLQRPGRFVPYAKGGVGLYHTSFDTVLSRMPDFYRSRLEQPAFGRRASFSDPAAVLGGGVTIWLNENVTLRPEVDVKLVMSGSAAHAIATAGFRVAYHFEDHPMSSRTR